MNDIQMLSMTLTVVVPFFGVMLGVLINNTRLNDVKEHLREKINVSNSALRAEMRAENAEMRAENTEMRSLIEKHHSEIMAKLIEMDNRIVRLESQRLIQ